ncbi:MAG: threonine--tRNA ligase, partial [Candidatus Peregrinibacteria bacterium]
MKFLLQLCVFYQKRYNRATMSKLPSIEAKRHSLSHVLAQAVLDMFPEAKLGIGPSIENGFYYDFDLPRTLIPEDLLILEKKMKHIIKQNQAFEQYSEPIDAALKFLKKTKQDYKIELVKDLKKEGEKQVSFYKNGPFVDLCKGPHVNSTGQVELGTFKLDKIAGAYWRGSEKNPMLQRIYGLAFDSKQELEGYVKMMEEAAKRDHRKLGKELELFTFSDNVGPGLPLWLPKGAVLVEELEALAKEEEFKAGYVRVRTPHLTKGKLYEMSGHLPLYAQSMYPPMKLDNDEDYYVKPMNCPHHHMCFMASPKSYRDLPLRYAEYGTCYRYEDSGALFGLMRVRSMQMNDAHIYCTEEQFETEFIRVTELYLKYFKIFGIKKYLMRLSLHDPAKLGKKYVDEPALWKKGEAMVRKVMKKTGIDFEEAPDEAAFYGPKIDIDVWSAIGREFTLATNQVDFAVPKRMGITYTDEKGEQRHPLIIHRAPLSTHERFIGFLIEHFGGAFPTWLAPVQAAILPIAQTHHEYAEKLHDQLKGEGIRPEVMLADETLGKRIRTAEKQKYPYMLVIGDKEVQSGEVTVRRYGQEKQETVKVDRFMKEILQEIKERRL